MKVVLLGKLLLDPKVIKKVVSIVAIALAVVFIFIIMIILLFSMDQGNSTTSYDDDEFSLLVRVVSAEARGEPHEGQLAVAAVILNRVKSSAFPDSISEVVYQKNQFTCMTDGQINQEVSQSCYQAVQEALQGNDPTGGCLYYYNPKTATSKWIFQLPIDFRIGNHVFSKGLR